MGVSQRRLPAGEQWFEALEVGDFYDTGGIIVTEAHVVAFAGISGDLFDVHMDEEFAKAQGFEGRLAHGLLGLALTDGLKNRAGARIMASASLGWNWAFKAPILIGDRITARIEVAQKRMSKKGLPILTLAIEVTKQGGAVVQSGETTLLARTRPVG